jgi:hypothetical protein
MGLNSTFFPYLAGGLTIRPTKTKFMKFGEGIALRERLKSKLVQENGIGHREPRDFLTHLRERFLSPNFYKKRALTTENTESAEIFNRFFSVIFVISVVKNSLRNTLLRSSLSTNPLPALRAKFTKPDLRMGTAGRRWQE